MAQGFKTLIRGPKSVLEFQSDKRYSVNMKGKVKWFNDQKGYGFITPEDGSRDLFVHHSAILSDGFRTLAENQEVEFEVVQSEKGPKATNVKKA